jgi:hypothetical protein
MQKQQQQLGQPVEFATRLQSQPSSDVGINVESEMDDDDGKSLGQIQSEQAGAGAVPPVPAIPNAHASAPRSRTAKRSPVLSYAEAEAEEERIYQATDQNTDLKRMASFGPKLKKNAPAPWEVEGGDEEFLMLPHHAQHGSGGSSSPSATGKQQSHQWFARKSTDVREHGSSPEKAATAARPSIDRMRSAADSVLTSDDATDSGSGNGSFFANTRARSKSVSSSAAGMLKGLGLTASSAQPIKKKLPKLGKQLKGGDEKKSRMPLSAGISSADYQNVPADWSPTSTPSEPTSATSAIPPMPLTPSQLPQRGSSTSSAAGLPLRQSSRQDSAAVPPVPITQETYRMRQSSSNDSNNLSSISPTDASQSTAATSPATPSFGDVISSSSKNVMTASPTLRSAQMEAMASAGSEILNDDTNASNVMQNKYEGTTPYKLISLEQARMNQIREKELARQRIEAATAASSSTASDTPRAGSAADGFPTAASRTSLSSDHHPTRGADTKSLRSKKSGFLRMFNKDKGMDAPALPPQVLFGEEATRDPSVPVPRGGASSQLAAPALSLRPMSSMFSNFEPELLDGSVAGSGDGASTGPSPQRSPALSSGSRGQQELSVQGTSNASLSSRRRGPAPAEIIPTPYSNSAASGPKSANSLFAANAMGRRTSSDTNESQGAFFSPATSPAAAPEYKQRPSSVHSYDSSASGRPTIEAAVPSSAWKDRVMEIEQKMAELANELSAMRHQQAAAGFVPTSPFAEAEASDPSSPSLGSHSPNPDALTSTTSIPPCSTCGCECAEKRRQQALNEAAVLRGVSILARGRAIKPLGQGNTTKFGGYRDR